jgi:hypothetical protein
MADIIPIGLNAASGQKRVLKPGDILTDQNSNSIIANTGYSMVLGGPFDSIDSLPLINIGTEVTSNPTILRNFRARRATAGSSGNTTIQLEINGSPVSGATLSWSTSDGALALKTVSINENVAAGAYISFRITSKETGGEDIIAEVD